MLEFLKARISCINKDIFHYYCVKMTGYIIV